MTLAPDSGQQVVNALRLNYEPAAVVMLVVELTQGKATADALFASIQSPNMKDWIQTERDGLRAALGL
jgi:hypothetical protein